MVALVPSEFARSNRTWQGKLPLTSFVRLQEVLGQVDGEVHIQLEFSLDENGRIRIAGQVNAPAKLVCYTCMKVRRRDVTATIDLRVVSTDREAREIFADFDAVVLGDGPTTIQDLIEDDILLSIPSRVCVNEGSCEHRPTVTVAESEDAYRPFQRIGQVVKLFEKSN